MGAYGAARRVSSQGTFVRRTAWAAGGILVAACGRDATDEAHAMSATRDTAVQVEQSGSSRSGCPNEPEGLRVISDQGWSALPPNLPSHDPAHWAIDRGRAQLAIVADSTAPRSGPWVLSGRFPKGLTGGYDPFSVALDFPGHSHLTTVYQCFTVKHSANFTHNGNMSTKMAFFRGEGTNHGWRFGSHDTGAARYFFEFFLQEGAGDRDIVSRHDARPLGRWRQYEVLVVGNTQGHRDGIVRVWADGRQILDRADVAFWAPSQQPGFRGLALEPTYGGGRHPVPRDMYLSVDHWYVSGAR